MNQSSTALATLVLAVDPNRWMGGFFLTSLIVDGKSSTGHVLSGNKLEIPLAADLNPAGTVTITLHYELYLPVAYSDQVYGYNSLQLNLLNWYPFVAPYDPIKGWLLYEPSSVGEHLVYDNADFDVILQFVDPTLPVVVAASAPAELTSGGWHYRFTARTFVFSASTNYLTSYMMAGPVTVISYYFAADYAAGEAIMQEVAKAVTTYSDWFAPYPYGTLSIVEAVYPDGMEADGLFFLSRKFYQQYDGTVKNNLIDIGIHEAAHEWWFGLVGNDQAIEPWLDEALSTYSERIFYEMNYPGYVNWWWRFRVTAFDPTGWVDGTIYTSGSFRPYTNAIYFQGAKFLEALRTRIGDEVFFEFLKDYSTQMSGGRATADDFFRILRQHTEVDFSDLVGSYFQTSH